MTKWRDLDDCVGCGKKASTPRPTAVARLAAKLDRTAESAIMRLTRVVVPPYIRVNPKSGKREHVDGYTYERKDGKFGTVMGKIPKGAEPAKPTGDMTGQWREGSRMPEAATRQVPNTPKRPVEGPSQTPNIKGQSQAPDGPQNLPDLGVELKVKSGSGTKEDPFETDDIETAAALILQREGQPEYYVKLNQERQVSTLLDRVKALVDDAVEKAGGDKSQAPTYDLCKVSVPGTNLFCVENKGIPRAEMPQLVTDTPVPGSPADKMERDENGEVNLGELYRKHLEEDLGISVIEEEVDPSYLRASQSELVGHKVAKLSGLIAKYGYRQGNPIFVTNDDYIVDGHHRWAGAIGAEYSTDADLAIDVRRIDASILDIIHDARKWAKEMGIPPKKAK